MAHSKKSKSMDGPVKSANISNKPITLQDEDEFVVRHIEDNEPEPYIQNATVVMDEPKAGEKIKVKFSNFVQLVATHNYEDVVQKNHDEEIIVSSNLLTDLANAHEQEEERRIPAIFIIGVVIGIVVTYILLKF
ncbi:hypothetical protein JW911_02120 [Candidatus Peregrinibacteria bacterium]|nr:hypothetical protein [Candidatus Peregrinibacteria bacterium]